MNKKILVGLAALAAVLIILLVVFWQFYPGVEPEIAPSKPKPPAAEPRPSPEPLGKPVVPGPSVPGPQEPPAVQVMKPGAPPAAPSPPQVSPPLPRETAPPAEPQEQYGLLLKSYRKYRDAKKMQDRLRKEGKPAFIRRDGRRRVYDVWVGPFPSRGEAERAAKALKAKLGITPKLHKLTLPVPK
jgi:cell division septation protein DedD